MNKKLLFKLLKDSVAVRSPWPERIDAMLATKITAPFDDSEFIYEIKWDGYRIIAYKQREVVKLRSRSFDNYSRIYTSITSELKKIPFSFIMDGEVVMVDEQGKPSFDLLQQVKSRGTDRLMYCVFDLLWIEGYDLKEMPLIERKKLLSACLPAGLKRIFLSPFSTGNGIELFNDARAKGLEGIVAKRADSTYKPGIRSANWLKLQTSMRQEFVIGGWTESSSGRPFRSLIFGYYDNGELIYFGHSGGGYTDKSAAEIKKKLDLIPLKKKPFVNEVETSTTAHWVKPVLVGEFQYATLTRGGKIRKPAIFKGLRSDKDPRSVTLDKVDAPPEKPPLLKKIRNEHSNWTALHKVLSAAPVNYLEVEGHKLELHGITQVLWTNEGITRSDLIRYYIEMSDHILPYLRHRPLSMHIKHNGVHGPGMYIKGMEGHQESWMQTFNVKRKHLKRGKSEVIDYLVCNDVATLVYVINLGCIDLNPWNSTIEKPLKPDYIIIDLDPTGGPFAEVVQVAKTVRSVLDKLRLKGFAKTSGKTGIHIFIPVMPVFTYALARSVAEKLSETIHASIPSLTTIENSIAKRGNRVFIDFNQNDAGDTAASAWSVRPYHIPTVSTPLDWMEVKKGLDPSQFTIRNIPERARKKKDAFAGIFSRDLKKENTGILRKLFG
jgi:bifunctional non-homologous end joining protein LigD